MLYLIVHKKSLEHIVHHFMKLLGLILVFLIQKILILEVEILQLIVGIIRDMEKMVVVNKFYIVKHQMPTIL